MPNHVTNGLSISTDNEKKLAKFKAKAISEQSGIITFDFNAIIPMPDEIMRTGSGSMNKVVDTQAEADHLNSKITRPFTSHDKIDTWVLSRPEYDRRINEYGATNWYDWSVKHWGTKWNAYDAKIVDNKPKYLAIQFNTAWSPPEPVFRAIEKMFDDSKDSVSMVSIDEDDGVEPYYFGDDSNFFVNRTLDHWRQP